MKNTAGLLMQLLRAELELLPLDGECRGQLDAAAVAELYTLSSGHDLAHMLASVLIREGLVPEGELGEQLKKKKLLAAFRYSQISRELASICEVLEDAAIPYIPLKGSVIRRLYREGWLRTSSDIDILVRTEDVERARLAVIEELDYTQTNENGHEIGLYSPTGVHFELHKALVEKESYAAFDEVLQHVWEHATVAEGTEYRYELSDAMFYYYHVAHMAKHYMNGGCGIRSFMDMYVLMTDDEKLLSARRELLAAGGLANFEKHALELTRVWFAGAEHSDTTRFMQRFILSGGTYGSVDNGVALKKSKKGGFGYLLSRIWLPYDRLKYQYPYLNGRKYLILWYEICRWWRLLLHKDKLKRSVNELRTSANVGGDEQQAISEHLKELGL